MATTKKTTTKVEKKEAPVAKVDTEKDELKKQIEELKAQMAVMAQAMAVKAEPAPTRKKDRNIRFVNLTNGTAVIKGSSIWKIEGRFGEKSFLEREAHIILNNMSNMIRSGMLYIADAQFVEENDLSEVYLNLLSDVELKELLNKDSSYVIDAFKTVCDGQKKVIIDMIRDKKAEGENIDANVLVELGKLSGQDLLHDDE